MGVSREKARSLDTLLKLLRRGVVTGGDVGEVVAHLSKVTGADAVAAGQGYRFAPWGILEGMPSAWITAHMRYGHQDAVVPRMQAQAPGTWFFLRDADRAQRESDLYERFSDHFGDGALVRVYSPFVSDLNLVLYRQRKRAFSEVDRVLLRSLYPHLALGLATQRALSALSASWSETLDDVLRSIAGHATISFPTRTVNWSEKAKRLWRARLEIGDRGWARLDRMLILACARFEQTLEARSQMLLPGIRVEFANVPPEGKEERRVLCLLVEDQSAASEVGALRAPAEALLSERQRDVARLLAVGATLSEAASDLSISLETARSYRNEIYKRLGIRSRLELSRVLR